MKLRIVLIALFVFLNVVDAALTQTMVEDNQCVQEANPVVNTLMTNQGMAAIWWYKITLACLIPIGLAFIFNRASWLRIMYGLCIGFGIFMIYMLGLFVYNKVFL